MLKKSQRWLLLLVIFLTPLVGFNNGFEQGKVVFFLTITTAAALVWLFRITKIKLNRVKVLGLIFVLVLLASSLVGLDPLDSLIGREPYYQGLILYLFLWLFALLISTSEISELTLSKTLTVSSSIVSVLAVKDFMLLNFLHINIQTYAGRVGTTFGQSNFYAGFLVMSLPFNFYLVEQTKAKIWSYLILVLLLGIFVSLSKTAIFLMLAIILIWLILKLSSQLRKVVLALTGALVVFSLMTAFHYRSGLVYSQFLEKGTESFNGNLIQNTVERRDYLWPLFWNISQDRPILGFGLSNVNLVYKDYFLVNKHTLFEANSQVSDVLIRLRDLNVDSSHNYLLDLLLFSGVLGVFIYLVLVADSLRSSSGIVRVGLLVYLAWVQFQNQSVVHLIYFWTLLGMI